MKFLPDTHTFLWAIAASDKIPVATQSKITNPDNEIFISAVSLWEVAIKTRIKKLNLGCIKTDDLIPIAGKMGMECISLSPEESIGYGKLEENSHSDPFDRMLIWQAMQRNLTIISKDKAFNRFKEHGLKLFWQWHCLLVCGNGLIVPSHCFISILISCYIMRLKEIMKLSRGHIGNFCSFSR